MAKWQKQGFWDCVLGHKQIKISLSGFLKKPSGTIFKSSYFYEVIYVWVINRITGPHKKTVVDVCVSVNFSNEAGVEFCAPSKLPRSDDQLCWYHIFSSGKFQQKGCIGGWYTLKLFLLRFTRAPSWYHAQAQLSLKVVSRDYLITFSSISLSFCCMRIELHVQRLAWWGFCGSH